MTIVFVRTLTQASHSADIPDPTSSSAAELSGFRAAQWTAFAFSMLAALLGLLFLRGVGVIGQRKGKEEGKLESTK